MRKHTVKVNIKGINWDLDDDIENDDSANIELPINIDGYIVVKSDMYDPHERQSNSNRQPGFNILINDILEELSNEFGYCINNIEEIKIIE